MNDIDERNDKMKLVAVGDVFITPKMMENGISKFKEMVDDAEIFFFGRNNRKVMRNVVKIIERGGFEDLDVPEGVLQALADADALMVHLCPVTKDVLAHAPRLKYVLCNRGGHENIDLEACRQRGISVILNPAHNANAVAEYTVGLILGELRNISRSHLALKTGDWREKYPNSGRIIELKDLTVGVIGFGNIGELVCEKLASFGCRILVATRHDHPKDNPRINWDKLEFTSFNRVVTDSDFITVHVRDPRKRVLFGSREFDMMKPTAYFINTARPYVMDYDALYVALSENKIAGAAIDVFPKEPLGVTFPLVTCDNVTLTNHRAGDTVNAYSDSPEMMLDALKAWIENGKTPKFLVGDKPE